jgi:hypothetical protein
VSRHTDAALGQRSHLHSTMAQTPSKKRSANRCLASPSTPQRSSMTASSPIVACESPSLARYKNSVPLATHVALLRILNSPDEYVTNAQIYNQNKPLFGEAKSKERVKVKNHRSYLEKLRKNQEDKFKRTCEAHGVAVRTDQQQSGQPSAPSTSMSRRNNRKCNVECGASLSALI